MMYIAACGRGGEMLLKNMEVFETHNKLWILHLVDINQITRHA